MRFNAEQMLKSIFDLQNGKLSHVLVLELVLFLKPIIDDYLERFLLEVVDRDFGDSDERASC